MRAQQLSESSARANSKSHRILDGFSSLDLIGSNEKLTATKEPRQELEMLSQSPNTALAIEAESVLTELSNEKYKGGDVINDPKIIRFVKDALEIKDRSFQQKISGGTEVVFANNRGSNFSFYEDRTRTAAAIAKMNEGMSPYDRLAEQDTPHKVQVGSLSINKFAADDIRISVSEIKSGSSHMKGFRLAV